MTQNFKYGQAKPPILSGGHISGFTVGSGTAVKVAQALATGGAGGYMRVAVVCNYATGVGHAHITTGNQYNTGPVVWVGYTSANVATSGMPVFKSQERVIPLKKDQVLWALAQGNQADQDVRVMWYAIDMNRVHFNFNLPMWEPFK